MVAKILLDKHVKCMLAGFFVLPLLPSKQDRLNVCCAADFGIAHFVLPGVIPTAVGPAEPVVLHIFIKGIQKGNSVQLRGNLFALSVTEEYFDWVGKEYSQPPAAIGWRPKLQLIGVNGRQIWESVAASNLPWAQVNQQRQPRLTMPIRYSANDSWLCETCDV